MGSTNRKELRQRRALDRMPARLARIDRLYDHGLTHADKMRKATDEETNLRRKLRLDQEAV